MNQLRKNGSKLLKIKTHNSKIMRGSKLFHLKIVFLFFFSLSCTLLSFSAVASEERLKAGLARQAQAAQSEFPRRWYFGRAGREPLAQASLDPGGLSKTLWQLQHLAIPKLPLGWPKVLPI